MIVFVSGSRSISELDDEAKDKLREFTQQGYSIVVGDAPGVDTAVQRYLSSLNYKNVTVYHCGRCRANVGRWPTKSIPSSGRGFEFYVAKDEAMARDASFGFVVWDGKSRGALRNIHDLTQLGKTVIVHKQKPCHVTSP